MFGLQPAAFIQFWLDFIRCPGSWTTPSCFYNAASTFDPIWTLTATILVYIATNRDLKNVAFSEGGLDSNFAFEGAAHHNLIVY